MTSRSRFGGLGSLSSRLRRALLCAPAPLTGLLVLVACGACGNPVDAAIGEERQADRVSRKGGGTPAEQGEPVTPPFPVQGDLSGLLLVWFDDQGLHTAQHRSEIPEAQRETVRIDSLSLPPSQRLDPNYVYLADVRAPTESGTYPVVKARRLHFDRLVEQAMDPGPVGAGVVLYKAAWCGACKAAEAYLTQRGVAYEAHDIEKDPAAQAEMQRKVQAAGLTPRGVPVIDFDGEILLGFDRASLDALIARADPQSPAP